jgi:adenylosuccinate synthase
MKKMNKVDVVVDLQFGSTGKGLIAGYLAKNGDYDMVVNANMPNAGHTFVDRTGRTWVHKVLPNGIVGDSVRVVGIGPGSVFDLDQLTKEYKDSRDIMETKGLIIHESAVVLQPRHREAEQSSLSRISSTMQGSGAALVEKMARDPESHILAKDALKGTMFETCVVSQAEWLQILHGSKSILLEGAQGYSLGINSGFWPFCTSRDCTPARFMADCGIPANWLRHVIGTARVHPIRVGNTPDGYSGDIYEDQEEISWESLGVTPETTTVTKRVRRVFTFSMQQIREAIMACQPDHVFLNFCNYDDELAVHTMMNINDALDAFGPGGARVRYTGWGPKETDVQDMG